MRVTYKQVSYLGMLLFFSVAVNSDWSASSIFWWGCVAFTLGAFAVKNHYFLRFRATHFKVWLLLFFGICLISMIFAINRSTVFNQLKTLGVMMVILCILDEEIRTQEQLERYMKLFMIAVAIMMIYVCLTINLVNFQLAQHGEASMGRWNGNDVGMKCAIFMLFALYFLDTDKRWAVRFMLIAASGLALVLLYFTASRKAVLIVMLGFSMYYYLKHPNKRVRNLLVITAGVYIAYLLVMNVPALYNSIGWRIEGAIAIVTGSGVADSSALLRSRYIEVGLDAFKKSPIFGYGIDNYRFINLRETGNLTYSHNNYIDILVGVGAVGFLIYYYYYVELIVSFFRMYLKRQNSLLLSIMAVCFFATFAMHFVVVSYSDLMQNLLILFFAKALWLQNVSQRRRP